jgi:hypothetical protein
VQSAVVDVQGWDLPYVVCGIGNCDAIEVYRPRRSAWGVCARQVREVNWARGASEVFNLGLSFGGSLLGVVSRELSLTDVALASQR